MTEPHDDGQERTKDERRTGAIVFERDAVTITQVGDWDTHDGPWPATIRFENGSVHDIALDASVERIAEFDDVADRYFDDRDPSQADELRASMTLLGKELESELRRPAGTVRPPNPAAQLDPLAAEWSFIEDRKVSIDRLVVEGGARLHALPWESLDGTVRPCWDRTVVTHFAKGVRRRLRLPADAESLRVLVVVARPRGPSDIDARATTYRMLESQLERLVEAPVIELLRGGGSLAGLEQRLNDERDRGHPYHVVHFDVHGELHDKVAKLVLESEHHTDGAAEATHVSVGDVARVLVHAKVQLAVLNACRSAAPSDDPQSNFALQMIEHGVPAVVGMRYPVSARAAGDFVERLYTAIARSTDERPLTDAVRQSRASLRASFRTAARSGREVLLPTDEAGLPSIYVATTPQLNVKPGETARKRIEHAAQVSDRRRARDQASTAGCAVGRDFDERLIDRLLFRDQNPVVVVTGIRDSGKSTFLRDIEHYWDAINFADYAWTIDLADSHLSGPLGMDGVVRLFDHALTEATISQSQQHGADPARTPCPERPMSDDLRELTERLRSLQPIDGRERGVETLFLLDGIDAVDPADGPELATVINELRRHGCRFVVTARRRPKWLGRASFPTTSFQMMWLRDEYVAQLAHDVTGGVALPPVLATAAEGLPGLVRRFADEYDRPDSVSPDFDDLAAVLESVSRPWADLPTAVPAEFGLAFAPFQRRPLPLVERTLMTRFLTDATGDEEPIGERIEQLRADGFLSSLTLDIDDRRRKYWRIHPELPLSACHELRRRAGPSEGGGDARHRALCERLSAAFAQLRHRSTAREIRLPSGVHAAAWSSVPYANEAPTSPSR